MKLTLTPTNTFVTTKGGAQARLWEGDADDIPCVALVLSIGVKAPAELPELHEVMPPSIRAFEMFIPMDPENTESGHPRPGPAVLDSLRRAGLGQPDKG